MRSFRREDISAVIVAFQSAHVLSSALDSVRACGEIICVDNASTDQVEKALADSPVIYIRNDRNVGFGSACNQAASLASREFILFLNPDVLLHPGAIEALLMASSRYPDADVFVPRTTLATGKLWFHDVTSIENLRSPPQVKVRGEVAGDCCIRFVDGGVFMIRRSSFLDAGGFDERMFLYYEDEDLSLRLLESNRVIVHVDDALAVHTLGTSSRPTFRYVLKREFHKKNSQIYVMEKYGIQNRLWPEVPVLIAKALFYLASLQVKRAFGSFGRLGAVLSSLAARSSIP